MLLILALYAICASTFTICKALLAYSQPIFFVGFRMILAGIALVCYHLFFNKKDLNIAIADRWLFAKIILFHIYFAYIFDLWSLQFLTSSQSSFLYNLSPFLAALFSYYYFSEKMTFYKWIGLLIGCLGFLPELFHSFNTSFTLGTMNIAQLVLLLGIISASYGWITVRALVKDRAYSSSMVNGVGMIGGGILALFTSLSYEQWWIHAPVNSWIPFLQLTLAIIIVGNFIFYNLYSYLLTKYSATLLSFAGFTCPLFVALYGWLFLGESVSWTFFLSIAVVSIGLYLFYYEELKQGYIQG